MMVTFISQCEKNSLKKTRRVLDTFASRVGDNVWQTVITQNGLDAVKKLLRRTASKNTAVSCHWMRSRARNELVWVVGNKNKFNFQGEVPVNRTQRVLTGSEWENGWTMATSVQILATLAALLHDLGKATIGFQKKLTKTQTFQADPYRHEWISLRLFEAMIDGCNSDNEWLERLANFNDFSKQQPDWLSHIHNDGQEKSKGLSHLPPMAKIVAWLIVTHHRLPADDRRNFSQKDSLQKDKRFLNLNLDRFYQRLAPFKGWVCPKNRGQKQKGDEAFRKFAGLASESSLWQKSLKRWAAKALQHPALMHLPEINNPLLMHLSRLCLMVGDHNYSSLDSDDKRRVAGDKNLTHHLIANTCRPSGEPKQALDEHLMGVAQFTGAFARLLPHFQQELPHVEGVSAFAGNTRNEQFIWQNRAWKLVRKHQKEARSQGFFGVSLASTGKGKTLGNARIMAALSDPDTGPRFTVALGLRVLTLQTGLALRQKLHLDETALAILMGGSANRTLFELHQEEGNDDSGGSESAQPLIHDQVDYDHCALDQETLGTIIQDTKARDLLYAPIVSCTVDHIMGATETLRGGRHIVPILRLLTSDLILDEPDDFDQNDLPALSRLVFMAGMLGSHVLLSSATLTPDLVSGLFEAYQQGRKHWRQNQGENGNTLSDKTIYCAWFDEFHEHIEPCLNKSDFDKRHTLFVKRRVNQLQSLSPQRIGHILPVDLPQPAEDEKINNQALADTLVSACDELHKKYHDTCSETGKTASVGLVRLANINSMFELAKALYETPVPKNVQVHLCCYHARQLLLLRNLLENRLDRILNRNDHNSLFDHQEIREAVSASKKQHHVFIVLATAVAEVGRDHDYDWAIIEPSSMRSVIQLVGRVWRHRPDKIACEPNVLILNNNIKALQAGSALGVGKTVFTQPGFESTSRLLDTHNCSELITERELSNINAVSRIIRPDSLNPTNRLADLEHAVMSDLFSSDSVNVINAFWQENTAMQANIHLQKVTPFRYSCIKETEFVAFPDVNQCAGIRFRYCETAWEAINNEDSVNSQIRYTEEFIPLDAVAKPWLVNEVPEALDYLSEKLKKEDRRLLAMKFATVRLDENKNWRFHPAFGFWPA
ncbi:CRISPR-associated nuclease/helicase Cas3 subtype I-F/YPEST [invertebrate metagenome]|uniref:CRISPR-associated nuclease/helicase Cas3 subtype I-F/YPEST n=1 Tax=invertebrate metagenome TaxID=1711999 RepID=A0A2H9T508_9ZZZZ